MPKYKIQLHPESAPLTVNSKEAVNRVLSLYSRLKKAHATAYPYFVYPLRMLSVEKIKAGVLFCLPIVLEDAEGGDCKECYRGNLAYALTWLYSNVDKLPEAEARARAEAEALEVLSLIDEYNALPEALPYKG